MKSGAYGPPFIQSIVNRLGFLSAKDILNDGLTGPTGGLDWQADMFEDLTLINLSQTEADYADSSLSTNSSGRGASGTIDFGSIINGSSVDTFTIDAVPLISAPIQIGSTASLLLPFDTDNGTTTPDNGKTGHTVTLQGDATTGAITGAFGGNALDLDGAGDYASTPANSDFDSTGEILLEARVRFRSTTGAQVIMGQTSQTAWANSAGIVLDKTALGDLHFGFQEAAQSWRWQISNTWNPSADTWYHIAATRDSSNVIRVAIDGVIGANTVTDSGDLISTLPFHVGANNEGGDNFNGYIDEVRVLNDSDGGYSATFTPPTSAYTSGATTLQPIIDAVNAGPQAANWEASSDTPDASSGTITLTSLNLGTGDNGKAPAATVTSMTTSNPVSTSGGLGANVNGVVQTTAFVAQADPDIIHVGIIHAWATTGTMNTDLVVSVSRDNGATFKTATMVSQGTFVSGQNWYTAEVDMSLEAAGDDVVLKIQGANGVESIIHGRFVQVG